MCNKLFQKGKNEKLFFYYFYSLFSSIFSPQMERTKLMRVPSKISSWFSLFIQIREISNSFLFFSLQFLSPLISFHSNNGLKSKFFLTFYVHIFIPFFFHKQVKFRIYIFIYSLKSENKRIKLISIKFKLSIN